jgi:hypothetical protein
MLKQTNNAVPTSMKLSADSDHVTEVSPSPRKLKSNHNVIESRMLRQQGAKEETSHQEGGIKRRLEKTPKPGAS